MDKSIEHLLEEVKKQMSVDVIDTYELMKMFNISSRTAQTWRDTGIMPYSKVGKKIYYDMRDVEALLERTRVGEPRRKEVRHEQ